MINGDGIICLVISGNGGLLLFTKNPRKWNSPTRTHMITHDHTTNIGYCIFSPLFSLQLLDQAIKTAMTLEILKGSDQISNFVFSI